MLSVSHGNIQLAWNKLLANPAVLIRTLCDLPLTPATKPTAEEQQWGAQALTGARFYLHSCYSVVACSEQVTLCAAIMYKSLVPFKGGICRTSANWKRIGDS